MASSFPIDLKDGVSQAANTINASLDKLINKLTKLGDIGESLDDKLGGGLLGTITKANLLSGAIEKIASGVVSFGIETAKFLGNTYDNTILASRGFEILTGSVDGAQKALSASMSIAEDLGIPLIEVEKRLSKLLAVGTELKTAELFTRNSFSLDTLKEFLGVNPDNIINVIRKLQYTGQLSQETMNGLGESGINTKKVFDELDKQLGKNQGFVASVFGDGKKLPVNSQVLQAIYNVLKDTAGEAGKRAGETGKELADKTWGGFAARTSTKFSDLISGVLGKRVEEGSTILDRLTVSVDKFFDNPKVNETLEKIFDKISEVLPKIADKLPGLTDDFIRLTGSLANIDYKIIASGFEQIRIAMDDLYKIASKVKELLPATLGARGGAAIGGAIAGPAGAAAGAVVGGVGGYLFNHPIEPGSTPFKLLGGLDPNDPLTKEMAKRFKTPQGDNTKDFYDLSNQDVSEEQFLGLVDAEVKRTGIMDNLARYFQSGSSTSTVTNNNSTVVNSPATININGAQDPAATAEAVRRAQEARNRSDIDRHASGMGIK